MNTLSKGQSLELYFIDGRPDGMLTAEVFNWTGHVLMTPRTRLSDALQRPEARYTGVYLLLGEGDNGPMGYIGEGEDIGARMKNHDASRDWWTSAVLVTTAGNNLNKAHAKYLEARLIEEARKIGKVTLENGNTPARPSLSEAARANMENFLDYLMMVLPALRIDSFLADTRPRHSSTAAVDDDGVVVFELHAPKHDLRATAHLVNGEFVVQAGSTARSAWKGQGTASAAYRQLSAELRKTGVLAEQDGRCVFTEHYAFKSPSAAAAVVIGRSANGTLEWKRSGSNKTYKQWEVEKLAQVGISDD